MSPSVRYRSIFCNVILILILITLGLVFGRQISQVRWISELYFGKTASMFFSWLCCIDRPAMFFSQTRTSTGTICGAICEGPSPLKCESVQPIQMHTPTSSWQTWLQIPHRWRANRKEHPVTNKLSCCYTLLSLLAQNFAVTANRLHS